MESLSRAYLQAIAAQAGLNYSVHNYDYGIDITLRDVANVGGRYIDTGLQIDVQLKCTSLATETDSGLKFDLDVQTYNYLRDESARTPRVLIVLNVPKNEAEWVVQSEESLCLRRCAYWTILRGAEAAESKSSIRITIPTSNIVTPAALMELIRRPFQGDEHDRQIP